MLTKMTVKNQITIPKAILVRANLINVPDTEKYFDVEVEDNSIILKPVIVTIEERISEKQWEKFESKFAKIQEDDVVLNSAKNAKAYLKKRIKKK
jgi:bifunctional DNA-binding transcriptional regulator/antitoxin component of YhaV-PrlF toxin-antitoxin module